MNNIELIEKIKTLKEEFGVEYSFIAKKIGMNRQNFNNFMNGKENRRGVISEERANILRKLLLNYNI